MFDLLTQLKFVQFKYFILAYCKFVFKLLMQESWKERDGQFMLMWHQLSQSSHYRLVVSSCVPAERVADRVDGTAGGHGRSKLWWHFRRNTNIAERRHDRLDRRT